jgi:hypothetical protein
MASGMEMQARTLAPAMSTDPHADIAEREAEDERELMRAAISSLNALRQHSLEVRARPSTVGCSNGGQQQQQRRGRILQLQRGTGCANTTIGGGPTFTSCSL